jgi:hypothetical protein
MFEGFTLEQQRRIELERGWKPTYSALTYCTAEAVLLRNLSGSSLDCEILIAERTSGAPDCLGKTQGKWGTYIKPTDRSARYAIHRGLKELFGWDVIKIHESLLFVGIVGPELYKATVSLVGQKTLTLAVTEEQAEITPFEAKVFCGRVDGYELGKGSYLKSTKNARWVKLSDLITEQGNNQNVLYWTMIWLCLSGLAGTTIHLDELITEFTPGEYRFCLH